MLGGIKGTVSAFILTLPASRHSTQSYGLHPPLWTPRYLRSSLSLALRTSPHPSMTPRLEMPLQPARFLALWASKTRGLSGWRRRSAQVQVHGRGGEQAGRGSKPRDRTVMRKAQWESEEVQVGPGREINRLRPAPFPWEKQT